MNYSNRDSGQAAKSLDFTRFFLVVPIISPSPNMHDLSFFVLLPILAPLPTMFSLPKFHSQMSFFFTAHETRSMLKRISSAPKISTTTSPSPALSYQAQACSKPPIQIFMLFKIGSNRAVKKPSTILAFWRLLTLSA